MSQISPAVEEKIKKLVLKRTVKEALAPNATNKINDLVEKRKAKLAEASKAVNSMLMGKQTVANKPPVILKGDDCDYVVLPVAKNKGEDFITSLGISLDNLKIKEMEK